MYRFSGNKTKNETDFLVQVETKHKNQDQRALPAT